MTVDEHVIHLEKACPATPEALFAAIEDGRFFKLTGADVVEMQFREDGPFRLEFIDRGRIDGVFQEITRPHLVRFSWNVNGFRPVPDVDTVVTLRLSGTLEECLITLDHEGVQTLDSAEGKRRGWTELLEDVQKVLGVESGHPRKDP